MSQTEAIASSDSDEATHYTMDNDSIDTEDLKSYAISLGISRANRMKRRPTIIARIKETLSDKSEDFGESWVQYLYDTNPNRNRQVSNPSPPRANNSPINFRLDSDEKSDSNTRPSQAQTRRRRTRNNRRQPARTQTSAQATEQPAETESKENIAQPRQWRRGQKEAQPMTYIQDLATYKKKWSKNKQVLLYRLNLMKYQHKMMGCLPFYDRRNAGVVHEIETWFSREFEWPINKDLKWLIDGAHKIVFSAIMDREREQFPRNLSIDGQIVSGANQSMSADEDDEDNDNNDNDNNDTGVSLVGLEQRFRKNVGITLIKVYEFHRDMGMLYERILADQLSVTSRTDLYNLLGVEKVELGAPFGADDDAVPPMPTLNFRSSVMPSNVENSALNVENNGNSTVNNGNSTVNNVSNEEMNSENGNVDMDFDELQSINGSDNDQEMR